MVFQHFKKASKSEVEEVEQETTTTAHIDTSVFPEPVEVKEEVQPNMTNTALSFYKDKENGMWTLIKVMFDPVTKVTGQLEVLEVAQNRSEIEEKFKITAARQILVATLT